MASTNPTMGIFFLCQTVLGLLGNSALLCSFVIADLTGIKEKTTDPIVKHLTWANITVLLVKGIPQTMAAFGQTYFLGDISCKLIFYFHRVARGVSLGSTCLLSVIQAITISPSNSIWAQLKASASGIIGPSLGLCWALYLLVNSFLIMTVTDMREKGNLTEFRQFVYCLAVRASKESYTVYLFLLSSSDVVCLGLMLWASGSMVFILSQHKQRVQHIHRSVSHKLLPETKATQSVLTLVSTFVVLYGASVILILYFPSLDGTDTWLVSASVAMSACFPALCPFVLIRHYIRGFQLCSTS